MGADTRAKSVELNAALNVQCKAAIVRGSTLDSAGRVQIQRMVGFDMGPTTFAGLGCIACKFMDEKLAKEAAWALIPSWSGRAPGSDGCWLKTGQVLGAALVTIPLFYG